MQEDTLLNRHYVNFKAGLQGKKELEEIIFRNIKKKIHNLPGWNTDDYCDFVSWLYPRISAAIDTYQDTGSTFDAYINTLFHLSAKEYRLRQVHAYTAETSAWITQLPDMYACDNNPVYSVCDTVENEKRAGKLVKVLQKYHNPRQLLMLVLKCCNYVSDEFAEKISPELGVEPAVLMGMIDRLRKMRIKRELEINRLRERANMQFCRNLFYQQTLQCRPENYVVVDRLTKRLERGKIRLAATLKRLSRLRSDPSNQQISEILGVARGTVDSALHYIKRLDLQALDNNQNKNILN